MASGYTLRAGLPYLTGMAQPRSLPPDWTGGAPRDGAGCALGTLGRYIVYTLRE